METLGQLTGGLAHDFNNLLTPIFNTLELAQKRLADDARMTLMLGNALQAAQRAAALIQRMLAFSRRRQLAPAPTDAAALVRAMDGLLRSSVGPAVEIALRFPPALPAVMVDPTQLELSLLNLATNARDAMPHGGRITIGGREEQLAPSAGAELPPGGYVCLSVADTGEGMDETTLARAIEPFFTTKDVGKGTGLGLAMVHGIAEQSGGRLVLKSRLGQGTVVEIWLPVAAG